MRHNKDVIEFGTTLLEYRIEKSTKRTAVSVSVFPDGMISVSAPSGTTKKKIADKVKLKAGWILKQREFFQRLSSGFPKQFVSGESFHYLGRQYKLRVIRKTGVVPPSVTLVKGQFQVRTDLIKGDASRSAVVRAALLSWYRQKAEAWVGTIADHYSSNVGLEYTSISIRDMKQRWGSGGTSGKLAFNWRIIMAPKRLVEYVVAHELCHIRYNDHSKDFWRLLERIMPDCERRRIELAIQGPKFDLKTECAIK